MKRTRRDLIKVGLFVVVAGALLVGSLLWIAGSRFFRPVASYTIIFDKSVSGLNPGANVEYQGVVVGRVRDIWLTNDLPPKVSVYVDVEPGTPIRKDTVAALLGSLVTGIKFIQLQGGTAEPLPPDGVIRGDVTSIEEFRDQVAEISDRAATILRKFDEEIFTTENSAKVTAFVDNLNKVSESLATTMETFRSEETGKSLAQLVRQLSEATANFNKVITDFYGRRENIFGALETTLRDIDELARNARELVRRTDTQVAGTGGSLGTLLGDLSAAIVRLQETLDVVRSDPSVLIRGREIPEREFQE